jgi:hypothetical protein
MTPTIPLTIRRVRHILTKVGGPFAAEYRDYLNALVAEEPRSKYIVEDVDATWQERADLREGFEEERS